ncbi:MAG: aminotransferase class III-fold pyridoxal phosphate-dependent enzyme [Candidatus Omnitrophota bacterium]
MKTKTNLTQELYEKAKKLIPGGTQLLSKRPEMHLPGLWPAYFEKARGCEVWDLDGNKYIDMSYMGIGSCALGYADPDVDEAVIRAIGRGSMCTLNCPEEVELAELLCRLHPWADMARFARTGGEAMAIAVRIARAATGKDSLAFCGYHGWHDWYLSANLRGNENLDGHLIAGLEPRGVPRGLEGTAIPFEYNDLGAFRAIVEKNRGFLAAVIMEPVRSRMPEKGFLETVRDITRAEGIVLIMDEITAGWRLCQGGAHLHFGIEPDMAVFAKGMSNGYPMSAVIGAKDVMNSVQDTFISSTYWTERTGPAAAIAAIGKMEKYDVPRLLGEAGAKVKRIWLEAAGMSGLKIKVSGIDPLAHLSFEYDEPLVLKTLFTQFMLGEGLLATNAFYASYAHEDEHIDRYSAAVKKAFDFIAGAASSGEARKYLKKSVCHSGFSRLT